MRWGQSSFSNTQTNERENSTLTDFLKTICQNACSLIGADGMYSIIRRTLVIAGAAFGCRSEHDL
jgi:hypothetical protein